MKKIAFIIPYFGKFNNYFQLFLTSCKYNPTIDFIIFTDDNSKYDYPDNVKVNYISFYKLKREFEKKFDFKISLESPYKLCDYRPAYGFVFSDYIKKYDFWGYCDSDMIFGNIRNFYSDDLLDKYDKIGIFGHATVIRNTARINKVFMEELNGKKIYKDVFTMKENSSLHHAAFDEEFNNSINNLMEKNGYKVNYSEYQANIYTKSSNFKLTTYDKNNSKYYVENNKKAIFIFDKGNLFRYDYKTGSKKEYLYIHMQSRPMKVNTSNFDRFKIIPNSFDDIINNDLSKECYKHFNLHYFKLRSKNLIVKIKRKFSK